MKASKRIRRITVILLAVLIFIPIINVPVFANATEPSRLINVVYDDSSSMIIDDYSHEQVDRWCQAKYAMEVFAAMLGQSDVLNIYCMSDFSKYYGSNAHLSLKGSAGAETNVGLIHNMLTPALQTPFGAVEKAYSDLLKGTADEKWLVVLTDGQFQNAPSLNDYFAKKDKSVKVVFVALDKGADSIDQNEGDGRFFYQAADSRQILTTVTDASTRIFNSHKLSLSKDNKFSFDLPMSELVVFAQGGDVKINGIKTSDKELISGAVGQVSVRYSEKPSSDSYTSSKNIIAKNLVGKIATFRGDYDVGEYYLDVENAETVEIYYKPNISIALVLTDKDNNEVTELKKLEAGEYTVNFRFVKNGTGEPVPESKLLGDVKYYASISNNGKQLGEVSPGEKIKLEEGNVEIEAHATYLDYNTVTTTMTYKVWRNKTVAFSFPDDNPSYVVTKDGVDVSAPYRVNVTLEGKEITAEQWKLFSTPTVTFLNTGGLFNKSDEPSIFAGATVEKSDEPGVFLIYPEVRKGGPRQDGVTYGNAKFRIEYSEPVDEELWSGATEGTMKTKDGRSMLEKIWDLLVAGIVIGAVLFVLIGLVFKKRFPNTMKSHPQIICKPLAAKSHLRIPNPIVLGDFRKSAASRIIPYMAEHGTMSIAPGGIGPKLQLKAKSRSTVYLMNTEQLAGNQQLKINGSPIPAGSTKPIEISSSSTVIWTDSITSYECRFSS